MPLTFSVAFAMTSTIYGMFTLGLWRGCKIKPHRTWPQSLLTAAFVVVFTLYGVMLTLPALAPQFFDYGCQQQPGIGETDPPRECTRGADAPYCINTQFSLVSAWMRLSLPPLGVLVFATTWVRIYSHTASCSCSRCIAPLLLLSSGGGDAATVVNVRVLACRPSSACCSLGWERRFAALEQRPRTN